MQCIRLSYPHHLLKVELPETIAAIGFFDGIHKGHQKVINTAIKEADRQNKKSAVISFFPHPSVVLRKDKQHVHYLTPLREKEAILEEMGVDLFYIITFDPQLSKLLPEEFINHFIIGLNIKQLVAGFDFTYGHKGEGSMKTIATHAKGEFGYTIIDKLEAGDEKISSTLIRTLLKDGKIERVNELLGRAYMARGIVVEGDKRGRTIGFPTANIEPAIDFLMPRVGVYAVLVKHNGKEYKGMANLGYKPTFHEDANLLTIEVHIFDYKNDLYGEELCIEWRNYIRDEKKFNGIEELVSQIKRDEQEIRTILTQI
ncbi:bifunctional riboflavin kinase/FAD synthetase [Radiobacillus sp. PE A8.2]|uniref:bifunctional riboflavin kinase/FAD synthetase n=1 Tax=Radiobacillus sp. PE A8.2 TaxID=3380349 RepID=UPI00388D3213